MRSARRVLSYASAPCVLTVVHYDADFDLIASVTGQRCQWIIAAGSAD